MNLRTKIILYLFLPIFVLGLLIVSNNLYRSHQRLLAKDISLIEEELSKAALHIELGNIEAVTVAKTVAISQATGLFGKRQESVEFLKTILEDYPQFIGVSIGYEPDADGKDAKILGEMSPLPKWAGEKGRFLPYWFRDLTDDGRIKLERLVKMESSLYYQGVKEAYLKKPDLDYVVTEPYVYNKLNLVIEQMAPIIMDGKFKGVAGVDRSLDFLHSYLESLRPFNTAEFYLISGGGRIIASTLGTDIRTMNINDFYVDESVQGDSAIIRDIFDFDSEGSGQYVVNKSLTYKLGKRKVYHTYRDLFHSYSMLKTDTIPMLFHDPIQNRESFIASSYIPTGGWRLVMTVAKSEILAPTHKAVQYFAGFGFLGMIAILALIVMFASRFSRRIMRANALAQSIAKGDLSVSVKVDSKDEAGQLLRAIGKMVESLSSLLSQVKQSTIQLVSTATRITGAAKEQEIAIQDFGTSTAEIATAVNQISSTSRELYNTMSHVAESSLEAANMAHAGRQQLSSIGASMQLLADATSSISSKLNIMSAKAQTINKVVITISKVSEQTNLLSLNAAIEAEKAGEHGLGFAVVAREIRRLANQTAKATVDIDEMVSSMQEAVAVGVIETGKFSEGVQGGIREIETLANQFEGVIDHVEELSPRFDTVKEGMLSQTQGAQQISDAMSNLKEGAQRTSDSLMEFDRATRALHQAVNSLRAEVSRFKVSDPKTQTSTKGFPFRLRRQK